MPVLKDDLVVEMKYVEKNNQVTFTCSERLCAERTTPSGKKKGQIRTTYRRLFLKIMSRKRKRKTTAIASAQKTNNQTERTSYNVVLQSFAFVLNGISIS